MGEKTANLFSTKKDDTAEAMHDAGETISQKASDASEYVGDKSTNTNKLLIKYKYKYKIVFNS